MKCKLFTTQTCPKCPSMKRRLEEMGNLKKELEIEFVDAGTEKGLNEARKNNVSSVPTAIFFENEKELNRAYAPHEIDKIFTSCKSQAFKN